MLEVITIRVDNLKNDIGARWLMENQAADPLPPSGVLIQSLNEADARLKASISRYLLPPKSIPTTANDDLYRPEVYSYSLNLSTRKLTNKQIAITDLIHSFMVNSALTKVYASVNADLSAKHEAQSAADVQSLLTLLHTKLPPL